MSLKSGFRQFSAVIIDTVEHTEGRPKQFMKYVKVFFALYECFMMDWYKVLKYFHLGQLVGNGSRSTVSHADSAAQNWSDILSTKDI